MKKKILVVSDNPLLPTGYSDQARNIWKRLAKIEEEYEVNYLSCNGIFVGKSCYVDFDSNKLYAGNKFRTEGLIKLLPTLGDVHGENSIPYYLNKICPDMLWCLQDTFMLYWMFNKPLNNPCKKLFYFPSDGEPMVEQGSEFLNRFFDYKVAMAQFGYNQVKAEYPTMKNLSYIPHGIDTAFYSPNSEQKRLITKQYWSQKLEVDLTKKFIVGAVFRNQSRKMPSEMAKVWGGFCKDKEDVFLILHTDLNDPSGNPGLVNLYKRYGCEGKYSGTGMWYGEGLSEEELRDLYNIFDVHFLTTSGEGFGIPTLQAASCGVPSVLTDFTTTRELVEGHGECIKLAATITGSYNVERGIVSIADAVEKLNKLYYDRKLLNKYKKDCREFALAYDWKELIPKWNKLINKAIME